MQIEFTFWVFGENGNFDLRLFVMMMVVDFLRISTILVYIDFFDLIIKSESGGDKVAMP